MDRGRHKKTNDIVERNLRYIPGGTASSARYLDQAIVFNRADGAEIWDVGGRRYVDYNCAFGAILLGHRDQSHLARVAKLSERLDLIGLGTTELEGRLAEQICNLVPCAEMVGFCTSGTEATFHAIRVARAATRRAKIVKFQGAYHGWHDYVAKNYMSAPNNIGMSDPISDGALRESLDATLVLPFNDLPALENLLHARGEDIAAVLVEPQMHNIGAIEEEASFFSELRRLTAANGIVLIFDEVVTGFRHALGGYQSICGITPDLATFGKALGNGFPISLVAGNRDLMARFAPKQAGGTVLLGGTYNGLPMSVAAGLALIEAMSIEGQYNRLFQMGAYWRKVMTDAASRATIPLTITGFGSVCSIYFTANRPKRYEDLVDVDLRLDNAFRRGLLARGIACSTTPLRRFHLTLSHTRSQIDAFAQAAEESLAEMKARGLTVE